MLIRMEIRRRDLLLCCLCVVAGSESARAQQQDAPPKLAILSPDGPASAALGSGSRLVVFLQALREFGYIDGENIRLEFRFAENQLGRLPALAAELVRESPKVLYTWTSTGASAAARASTSIPIVVGPAGELVLAELAQNFARPAGNVTGLTLSAPEAYEKCLELLKEIAPQASRVGVLLNPDNPAWRDYPSVLNPTAERLGVILTRVESRGQADLERQLEQFVGDALYGMIVVDDSTLAGSDAARTRIINFAREHRIPSASTSGDYARYGGLLAIGPDHDALRRRAAYYVHRIIAGAHPSELPIERPTKFQLTVNSDTARVIGVELPPTRFARADEVID